MSFCSVLLRASLVVPLAAVWLCALDAHAQSTTPGTQPSAVVVGSIIDDTRVPIAGATVTLTTEGAPAGSDVRTGEDGRFSLSNVPAGRFQLTVSAPGFASQTISGVVGAGEISTLPQIRLTLAVAVA